MVVETWWPLLVHLGICCALLYIVFHLQQQDGNLSHDFRKKRLRETGAQLKLLNAYLKALELRVILIFSVFTSVCQLR